MADAALFIGWGAPVRGREAKALGVFNESLQYYAGIQQQGLIESFEPVLLEPHGGDLLGFVLLRGEASKLSGVRASPEFQRLTTRAGLIVDGLGVVSASIGQGLANQTATFQQQFQDLT